MNSHAAGRLRADAQALIARSRDHEARLTDLVASLEARARFTPGDSDVLAAVRSLCVAAREQREHTETLLSRMLGDHASPDAPRPRVLVADDSDDNRELARMYLHQAGFEVSTARNGLEAVIAAHREHPWIVLMDVRMPVLDGIEAARLLQASSDTRHMKVLAYTSSPELYDGPLTRLFADVLPKPATPDAMVAAVRRFVPAEAPDTFGPS